MTLTKWVAVALFPLALAGCATEEGRRAATGGALGAGLGAATGALITGTGEGALIGGAIGGASGAVVGAATTPQDECYVRDARGVLVRVPC